VSVQEIINLLGILNLLKSCCSTLKENCSMKSKSNSYVDESKLTSEEAESAQKTAQEYCRQFNDRLDHECGQIIIEITTSILQKAASLREQMCKTHVKTWIEDFREARNRKNFANMDDGLEHENEEQRQSIRQQRLLKIMASTKDPELFAEIVRMGVPMNGICADALGEVLSSVTGEKIVIKLQAEDGSWGYSDCDSDTDARIIVIPHLDGHFGSPNMHSEGVNNCLLTAVKAHIPELAGCGENDLREKVADEITKSKQCAHKIKQGWHKAAIKNGFYGGINDRRRRMIDK
jgi:hypothetical protein